MPSRLAFASSAVLLAVAVLASACGGKSAAPGVASLTTGGTTTTTPAAGGGTPPSSPSFGSSGNTTLQMKMQGGAQFASCMRKNGVANFPDPSSSGAVTIGPSSGIDPRSPKFQAAQAKCRKLLPNGGQPTPAQIAKAQQGALDFSKCMRAHGITDFPDPTFSTGGGIQMKIQAKGGLNPNDPRFQAAQKACRGRLGLGKGGGTTSVGPK
jgi:hypothetical protein